MVSTKREKTEVEMLVEQARFVKREMTSPGGGSTNRQLHYVAEPHIRQHKGKRGRAFYTHCHGDGPEKYLGSADYILQAVEEKRRRDAINGKTEKKI